MADILEGKPPGNYGIGAGGVHTWNSYGRFTLGIVWADRTPTASNGQMYIVIDDFPNRWAFRRDNVTNDFLSNIRAIKNGFPASKGFDISMKAGDWVQIVWPGESEQLPEETMQYWINKGYIQFNANKLAEYVRTYKQVPNQEKINGLLGLTSVTVTKQISAMAEPGEPSGPEEETASFWVSKGYSSADAGKISAWVRTNKMSPSSQKIKEILGQTAMTDVQKRFDNFKKNPDVINLFGILPDAVIDSFSRVFTGKSYLTGKDMPAEPGNYVAVSSLIAGAGLAAWEVIGPLISPGTAELAHYAEFEALAGNYAGAAQAAVGNPGVLAALKALTAKDILLGALLVSQLDVIAWGLGFSPANIHQNIQKSASNARGYSITLETAIKAQNWDAAKTALANMETEYNSMELQLNGAGTKFFEALGASYADLRTTLEAGKAALQSYRTNYPQISGIKTTFPSEIEIGNVQVIDGDTISWPGHPEAANAVRFVGIDAHESGTAAGKNEKKYLEGLIQGKNVTVYVDPFKQTDIYGRLLGTPYLGEKNIVVEMLRMFGKPILTATKYHDKNKYVDWDELTREATKPTVSPVVVPGTEDTAAFRISVTSQPSNAKLYIDGNYTHHLTPSDETELKDVMALLTPGSHTIKAVRGSASAEITTNITSGINKDIFLTLSQPVMAVPGQPAAEQFTVNIDSTPSGAKLYIDGIYTHHLTPSDAKELRDVAYLLGPGQHTIRCTKANLAGEKVVTLTTGKNEPVMVNLI